MSVVEFNHRVLTLITRADEAAVELQALRDTAPTDDPLARVVLYDLEQARSRMNHAAEHLKSAAASRALAETYA